MEPKQIVHDGEQKTVSLPDGWIKKHGLGNDDHVYLTEAGGGAVAVYPDASETVAESDTSVDADGLEPEEIERFVVGSYVLGRGCITVESDDGLDDEQILEVYAAERSLMGAGVVEESENSVVVRCSVNPEEFSMDELLNRLNSTAETMRGEAVEALLETDAPKAKRASRRERQANKVFVLVLRLLLTAQQNPRVTESVGLETPLHVVGTRASAKSLERAADYAEEAADHAQTLAERMWTPDPETADDLTRLLDSVDVAFRDAVGSLAGDIGASSRARNAYEETTRIEDDIRSSVLSDVEDADSANLFLSLVSALTDSAKEAIEIAEVASNRSVEE
jgi:phosphate uptake regulator